MGQYYTPLTQKKDDPTTRISYSLTYKGEFSGYKLTNHSWWENPFMKAFAGLLYKNPLRVAWVGDYSNGTSLSKIHNLYEDAYKNLPEQALTTDEISLDGLYLVNHSKKVYLDCSDYFTRCLCDGWCLHPISLLTAVGNGEGGGDYFGKNSEDVGVWAWDVISVENEVSADYTEVNYTFIEQTAFSV